MEQQDESSTENKPLTIKPLSPQFGKRKGKQKKEEPQQALIRSAHKVYKDAAGGKIKGMVVYMEFNDGNSKSFVAGEYNPKELVFYFEYMKQQLLGQVK